MGIGSPPRVRGTVYDARVFHLDHGITPARAGNSQLPAPHGRCLRDHPRACGEQPSPGGFGPTRLGSPPRVRGTAPGQIVKSSYTGITPARAGNRMPTSSPGPITGDHPRACGEQTYPIPPLIDGEGSPPRVRGTEAPPMSRSYYRWITPARAGNRGPLHEHIIS